MQTAPGLLILATGGPVILLLACPSERIESPTHNMACTTMDARTTILVDNDDEDMETRGIQPTVLRSKRPIDVVAGGHLDGSTPISHEPENEYTGIAEPIAEFQETYPASAVE